MPTENVGDWKVEYAKSGRSKCRLTGRNIPNKALRIGEIIEGEYGTYPSWNNFDDFAKSTQSSRIVGKTVFGLSALKKNDKERVNALVAGNGGGVAVSTAVASTQGKKPAAKPNYRKRSIYVESDEEEDEYSDEDDFVVEEEEEVDLEESSEEDSDVDSDDGEAYNPTPQRHTVSFGQPAPPADLAKMVTPSADHSVRLTGKRQRVSFGADVDSDCDSDDSAEDGTSMAHIYSKMGHNDRKKRQKKQKQMVQREPITPEQYIMGFINHLVRTAPPEDPVFTDPSKVSSEQLEQLVKDMNPVELQLLLTRLSKNGDNEVVRGLKRELRAVVNERNQGVVIVEE